MIIIYIIYPILGYIYTGRNDNVSYTYAEIMKRNDLFM